MTFSPIRRARACLWAGCCIALTFSHVSALGQAAPSDRKADGARAAITFTNLSRDKTTDDADSMARQSNRLDTRVASRISSRVTREASLAGQSADAAASIRQNDVNRQVNSDRTQPNE